MKTKKSSIKITLNKETIANLEREEIKVARGGYSILCSEASHCCKFTEPIWCPISFPDC